MARARHDAYECEHGRVPVSSTPSASPTPTPTAPTTSATAAGTATPYTWLSSAGTFSVAHQLSVSGCYATASDWADYDGDLDIAVTGGCNGPLEMSSPARGSRGPRLAAPARAVPGGSVKSSNDNSFLASEIL